MEKETFANNQYNVKGIIQLVVTEFIFFFIEYISFIEDTHEKHEDDNPEIKLFFSRTETFIPKRFCPNCISKEILKIRMQICKVIKEFFQRTQLFTIIKGAVYVF